MGNRVTIKSLELRLAVGTTTTAAASQFVRFMVILDKQCNGANLTIGNVLSPASFYGFRNLDYRKRFKVLLDKAFTLAVPGGDTNKRHFHIYMKFRRPIIVDYNGGGAGTIGDIASNSLTLLCIGTVGAGTNAASMDGNTRIRYLDN